MVATAPGSTTVGVVNFAHGEFVLVAMYAAFLLFRLLGLDPLVTMLPIAAAFFVIGYALQAIVINAFVSRPEHDQFVLLVGISMIIANGLLMIFGPVWSQPSRSIAAPSPQDSCSSLS